MRAKHIAAFLACSLAGTVPAAAATETGWISYISGDGHQLMLNSTDMFTLGPAASLTGVAIGDQVKLTFEGRGDARTISNIVKVPFNPTSS